MASIPSAYQTHNPIKERLLKGDPLIGGWAVTGSLVATEVLGHSGFDWVLIDGEHGANDYNTAVHQLIALNNTPASAFIRPETNSPVILKRWLDFGFYNFLIPMVETANQAQSAVQATRYPPEGIRGVSVSQRSNRFGQQADYFNQINQCITVVAQIESLLAIQNIEEIASVLGIDCLFIGPQDLAASMGYLAQPSAPAVQAQMQSLTKRILSMNKIVGILAADENDAKRYRDWGVTFVGVGSDQSFIKRSSAQVLKALRDS
jgi:2-dehydro-3-deoxyglucarate aldolase